VRIGVSPFATTRSGSFAVADAAFEGGIDTFWLGEGLLEMAEFSRWSGGMEPITWLAYLAGRYRGARVGLGASVLPLRDVQWLAKQSSTLDNLTEGNHILAVAPGFWEDEFAYRGVDFESRGKLFGRLVEGLQAAFDGREFESESLSLPAGARLSPAPYTPGGPPLWLAGGPATLRRALRMGLPFQARSELPSELAPVTRNWFEQGGETFGLRVAITVVKDQPGGSAEHLAGSRIVGPASYVADQLAAYAEIGISDLSVIPGNDDVGSLATVTALVSEVIPQLGSIVDPTFIPA
jgi:alkanesulfonate monooxygenase SsuD/methylene tetrahydromethanopterin reductase-like flavin-dependent oxidoreductase (luciferase family)